MPFRALVEGVDSVIFDALGDRATCGEKSLLGMFEAPWTSPRLGSVTTGLREPRFTVRAADAAGIEREQELHVHLPPPDGGAYTVVEHEPDGTGLVALLLRRGSDGSQAGGEGRGAFAVRPRRY